VCCCTSPFTFKGGMWKVKGVVVSFTSPFTFKGGMWKVKGVVVSFTSPFTLKGGMWKVKRVVGGKQNKTGPGTSAGKKTLVQTCYLFVGTAPII
jgi:hypothetical protein